MITKFYCTKTLILSIVSLAILSCGSGNDEPAATHTPDVTVAEAPAAPSVYDSTLAAGKVTDSIICREHATQSYALYLPSYYTPARAFPCICFFDAHGRGVLPVSSYRALAERYGFILIGSNTSKNGVPWEVTHDMVRALMSDTKGRMNIDPARVYTAGFSGGSRVAVTVAMVDGGVAGVIGAAAAFPKTQHEFADKFDYLGIAGNNDFNYTEMMQWDDLLVKSGFTHQLLTTAGTHDWPSAADYETAMLWMQVNAIKRGLQPANDTLISALQKDYDQHIAAAIAAKDWIKAYDLLNGAMQVLAGPRDVTAYRKRLEDLVASDSYKNAIALQIKLNQQEQTLQQELVTQFPKQDEQWWKKTIAGYRQQAGSTKYSQEANMYKRALSYLGFIAYMNTTQALSSGDLSHAETYLHIFKMADPENPDVAYLTATLNMKKGDTKGAIASLNDAVALGFNDVALLITDPAFAAVQEDARFKMIVANARKGSKKQ